MSVAGPKQKILNVVSPKPHVYFVPDTQCLHSNLKFLLYLRFIKDWKIDSRMKFFELVFKLLIDYWNLIAVFENLQRLIFSIFGHLLL